MNGKCMTKVMNSMTFGFGKSGAQEKLAEKILDSARGVFPMFVTEQIVIGAALHGIAKGTDSEVLFQALSCAGRKRDKTFLVELGFPEGERIL